MEITENCCYYPPPTESRRLLGIPEKFCYYPPPPNRIVPPDKFCYYPPPHPNRVGFWRSRKRLKKFHNLNSAALNMAYILIKYELLKDMSKDRACIVRRWSHDIKFQPHHNEYSTIAQKSTDKVEQLLCTNSGSLIKFPRLQAILAK